MKTIITLLAGTASLAIAAETTVWIGTGDKGIYTSTLNQENGSLSEPTLAAELQGTGFLAKHPEKPILYSTAQEGKNVGQVAAFKIGNGGKLTEMGRQPIKGSRLCHISLDHESKLLLGANYRDGNVVSYKIQADGSIGELASKQDHEGSSVHPQRQTKPHAHSIYSGPDNKFAYAPDLGIDKVMIYLMDSETAKLKTIGATKSPPGAGPRHMKFGKNGKQAYVLNELTVSISVFNRIAATGMLTPAQLVSTLPDDTDKTGMSCSEIRVSNDGKFIYCANRDTEGKGRDSLSVFQVSSDGKITRIQTIAAEVWIPRNINLDPSGKWLIVAGQKSNNVPVLKIDQSTGKISYTGHKISVPKAMCIEFSPASAK